VFKSYWIHQPQTLHTTSESRILPAVVIRVSKHVTNCATACRATDRILGQK